jgi:hypothetical protein
VYKRQDITGEYEFGEVATVSLLSSMMGDALEKQYIGTRYIIDRDSFSILGENICFQRENVTYKIEVVDNRYIKDYFNGSCEIELAKIIKQHKKRYRFIIYDENDEVIPYYVFLLDGKLLIGNYDTRSKMVLSSMNWVEKVKC